MLEPAAAERVALKEPTPSKDGPHEKSSPWGPMWRIEVRSEKVERERSFLAFISVDRKDAAPGTARRVSGSKLRGVVGTSAGERIAVLFSDADTGRVELGAPVDIAIIAGLEPGRTYRVTEKHGARCELSVELDADGAGLVATRGGFVRIAPRPCKE
jgi:hypothetical protein